MIGETPSRASPVAGDGGLLSPVWEDSVRAFQEKIVADLMKKEAKSQSLSDKDEW